LIVTQVEFDAAFDRRAVVNRSLTRTRPRLVFVHGLETRGKMASQECESGDASLIAAFLAQPLRRAAGRRSAFTVMAGDFSLFRQSVK